RWQRGQDEYDAWDNSGVSGHSVRSFYSPPKPFSSCASCHMPKVQSADPGSVDGLVHYHSFPAANTALAYVSNDTSWLARTIAFLKANRVTVDIFAVKRGNDVYAPLDAPAANVVPGETVLLDVVVRNKSIGHGFPGGTVDAQQPWLELIGKDANGNEFFHSGWVDSTDQHVDSTAHFFHARILTRDGELITTRGVHKWVATLYKHIIGPGSADVIHYKIHIPQDVGSAVTFVAKVHYKKFDEAFSEFVYEGKQMPQLPDVVMAENTRTIQTAATASPASAYTAKPEDRDRFNDYGIGSFFEEGERDASWAWKRTTQIDPNYADGYINLARIDLKEGYIEQMDTDLINAERVKPGYDKTKFFRGNLDKLEGKYPEALSELQQVYNDYPFERETIDLIGRIYYLQNEYTTAIQWYQKELDIDPEDKTPHYNMMLCYRAMGNKDEATNEEDAWRTYKEDEFQNEVTQKYRQTHESANNEAQPIHYHEDSRALINF
ncbi:MAG TPA: tetratricopeptide repeat protein, partial [Candidatus Kapabacteria bacterium]|nr:tetratricopeptide repeat protein [Candidatus Kapabacteria bacterium]